MLAMERFSFTRCGITKIDIKLAEVSIFDNGSLEWGSKAFTPEEKMIVWGTNRKLFEMQKDFWGRPGNPLRHNSCVRRPEDIPFGQKWAWISLNPNCIGGEPEIYVWGDEAYENVLCIIAFMGVWRVLNFDPMFGQRATPARAFIPTTAQDSYRCYNDSEHRPFAEQTCTTRLN